MGRIVSSDGSAFPASGVVIATTTPVSGDNMRSARRMTNCALSRSDGGFVLPLYPGDNAISVGNVPSGWTVGSIAYGVVNVTKAPLNLTGSPTSQLVITLTRAANGSQAGSNEEPSLSSSFLELVEHMVPDPVLVPPRCQIYRQGMQEHTCGLRCRSWGSSCLLIDS